MSRFIFHVYIFMIVISLFQYDFITDNFDCEDG